jgi:hypothetical protein
VGEERCVIRSSPIPLVLLLQIDNGVPIFKEGLFQVRQSYVLPWLFFLPLMSFLVGHIAESCSSEQRLCYNCRQPGHESSACPSPRTVAAKQCYSCGGVGHIQGSHCAVAWFENIS